MNPIIYTIFNVDFRKAFREKGATGVLSERFADTVISSCENDPSLEELSLTEIAAERGAHPADVMLDVALASNLAYAPD